MTEWENKTKLEEQTLSFFLRGMKMMWELYGGEKRVLLALIAWIAFLQFLALGFNLILKYLFDAIPAVVALGRFNAYTIILIAVLAGLKIAQLVIQRFAVEMRFLKSIIRLENAWPIMAHKKLLELSLGYHERENTGKKIEKINKGCERMVDILGRLRWGFLPEFFYILINFAIIMIMDWRLGLLFAVPFPVAAYFYLGAFRKAAPVFEQWEIEKERATGLFCQSVINVQTVQNYVQENKETESFASVREHMAEIDTNACIRMQYYFFAAITALWLFFIGTIVLGLYFVSKGLSTPGTIVYIISTGTVTLQGLWQLVHEYTEILRRLIAVFRMKELLDEEPEIKDLPSALIPEKHIGNFELKNLAFAYPNKEKTVLENFNLRIGSGEMIAFVGKSGEGKTTAAKLICRMFDPSSGAILLDGQDIRNIKLDWYRRLFAIVQQDVDIFDASILENIRYSYPSASAEEVLEAMKASYLRVVLEDKERFPRGMHEQVGEKGVKLSGGERQRVGIARAYLALLNGAKVLVLDEATSSLDSQAELAIQKMILKLREKQGITIIAIAHRLSTIQKADNIYVINNGKIIEKGSHYKLIERNGLYAELVNLQRMGELRK
jgi:ATP-binding cassette, subfamily B, bacterial